MKRTITIMVLAFVLSSCSSYSFRGAHSEMYFQESVSPQKYRLVNYVGDIHEGNMWSIARWAGARTKQSDIEDKLIQKYPNKFTKDLSAKTLSVEVSCIESTSNYWGMGSYFLSLGFYPANIIQKKDRCSVQVSIDGLTEKGQVKFRSNGWLSVWTTFGNNQVDEAGEYSGSYRHGGGGMKAPHTDKDCLNRQKDVFTDEVAAEINLRVRKLETERK